MRRHSFLEYLQFLHRRNLKSTLNKENSSNLTGRKERVSPDSDLVFSINQDFSPTILTYLSSRTLLHSLIETFNEIVI